MRDREFEELHMATLQILREVGLRVPDEGVLSALARAGIEVDHTRQCVKFSEQQVSEAISRAPKEVRLYNRLADTFLSLGRQTRFMPSGTGVAVFDLQSGERRSSKASDIRDMVRLQDKLQHLIGETDFVQPETRRNELLGVLKQGLQDFSISRERVKWGVPMPDDPNRFSEEEREISY